MAAKLAVTVLANRHSGKSRTWNTLFRKTVRTSKYSRWLYLTESEYVEVFLVSGSAGERGKYIGKIIGEQTAPIVLCSMQYRKDVTQTIDYFLERGYSMYLQWLNPGHGDDAQQFDSLGLMPYLLARESVVSIRDGKVDPAIRVDELRDFIYGWAHRRNLLQRNS